MGSSECGRQLGRVSVNKAEKLPLCRGGREERSAGEQGTRKNTEGEKSGVLGTLGTKWQLWKQGSRAPQGTMASYIRQNGG